MNVKQYLIIATAIFVNLTVALLNAQTLPSFSGAEGFGAVTVGGRGGEVYHVTNLNNSGPGSLRAALDASGPRTVVFDVSGIIYLTEDEELQITNPYITIAGQTAPGDGILIATEGMILSDDVSEVIIRYIRLRRSFDKVKWADYIGCTAHCTPNPEGDCLSGIDVTKNVMIDHVSTSWGTDENLSVYRRHLDGALPVKNVTIQWCISSEALDAANHAFGGTWGGQGVNYHHNLFANNTARNPSLSFSHFFDYRNNVIFNWRDRSMDGGGIESHVNVINNYYKPGPATGYNWNWSAPLPELKVRIVQPEIRTWQNWDALGLDKKTVYAGPGVIGWWYVNGNIVEGYPEVSQDNWLGKSQVDGNDYSGVQWKYIVQPYPGVGPEIGESHPEWTGQTMDDHPEWAKSDTVITYAEWPEDPKDPEDGTDGEMFVMPDLPVIATQSAINAFKTVLASVGATIPVRDSVDLRILDIVNTGIATAGPRENGIIIHPDEVGGYPVITEVHRPEDWDADLDGMPGEWEIARGLDPNNKDDRNDDYDNDGYTNLEEYLNDVGAFPAVQAINWDGEKDNRYANIFNWDIAFQPSRFDTAIISYDTVLVDAIDQHAGTLYLKENTVLNITSCGWLDVASNLKVETGCTVNLDSCSALIAGNILNNGRLNISYNASLSLADTFINNGIVDVSTWEGTLPSVFINNGIVIDGEDTITTSYPLVIITSPSNHQQILENSTVTIHVNAMDNDGSVVNVEFYEGSALFWTDNSSPYSVTMNNVEIGKYNISAKATDNDGLVTIARIEIEVVDSNDYVAKKPERKIRHEVKIYPSPVHDLLNIEFDKEVDDANVYLYAISGKHIKTVRANGFNCILDMSGLYMGLYIVRISSRELNVVKRVMKL